MSASHQYSQQIMSPHFASHSASAPYSDHQHSAVVAPPLTLLYSPGDHPHFSSSYNNQNGMPHNLHVGSYVGNYDASSYLYPNNQQLLVNNNPQHNNLKASSSSSASSLAYETEGFKKSPVITSLKSSPTTVNEIVSANLINNNNNNNGSICQNLNIDSNCAVAKTSIKAELFPACVGLNREDNNDEKLNANLTRRSPGNESRKNSSVTSAAISTSPSFSPKVNITTDAKNTASTQRQAHAASMANSVIDAAAVSSAAAAYASAIASANNIENSDELGNSIVPCHLLPSIESTPHHSLNGFYPGPGGAYIPPGFSSDHLLGAANGLPTTHSSLPSPYCWPTSASQSSHSYNQTAEIHGYSGLSNDIYNNSRTGLSSNGIPAPSQLQYDVDISSTSVAASSDPGMNASGYDTSSWPSQYYLPSDDKLADVENCGPSQLHPYMNLQNANFYVSTSQHPLQSVASPIDSFAPAEAASTTRVSSSAIGSTALCNSTSVGSNANSGLALDLPAVDLYGNFQQNHLQHLHDSVSTTSAQFIDLMPNQQQPQLPDLTNIYQQELLLHQRQNHVYNNLVVAENPALLSGTNHSVNMSASGMIHSGPGPSSKTTPASKTGKPTTVRRGRSTKTKTTVSSVIPSNVASNTVVPFSATTPLNQLPSYGHLDKDMFGGRSSSISNYSRSLSPFNSGVASKIPRKSRSRAKDSEDDDGRSIEDKESERRTANNTRERIRVRDINMAFKELAKLCSQHMPNTEERGLTKLGTLLKAVDLIPMLEEKVRQRNLDPRMACLKRNQSADTLKM